MTPFTVLATGPSGPVEEFEALRAAGLDVVIGRPLDMRDRRLVEERWIAGAAVDAFTKEPLPADSALRRVDPERMILTPHNIAHSEAGRRANLKLALEQILALARGDVPAHVVNPAAIARWRARRGH